MEFEFEEFLESDVIFSDVYSTDQIVAGSDRRNSGRDIRRIQLQRRKNEHQSLSSPVDIPGSNNSSLSSSFRYDDVLNFEDLVPPHVIVERRSVDSQIACSFNSYERKANAMRGKNLIHVRNSILRLTGFLES